MRKLLVLTIDGVHVIINLDYVVNIEANVSMDKMVLFTAFSNKITISTKDDADVSYLVSENEMEEIVEDLF